jgi:hypothetical protein
MDFLPDSPDAALNADDAPIRRARQGRKGPNEREGGSFD